MANPNTETEEVMTGSTPPPPPPTTTTSSLREEVIVPEPKNRRNVRFAFVCVTLASMTSILSGYNIGVMSGAVLFIKEDLKISDTKVEILAGILNLYSLAGSLAAGRTCDWIGRRYTIVLAAAVFFVGALLMAFAPSYVLLMLGRFVAGVGVGYALTIAPVYTAELSPASSRGFLSSFPERLTNEQTNKQTNKCSSTSASSSGTSPATPSPGCPCTSGGASCSAPARSPPSCWPWACWRCRSPRGGWS